MEEDEADMSHV